MSSPCCWITELQKHIIIESAWERERERERLREREEGKSWWWIISFRCAVPFSNEILPRIGGKGKNIGIM